MKNFQIIKINEDSSIKVEFLKTDYIDIPNPDNLKGLDLLSYITIKVADAEVASDFLDAEPNVLETLEINVGYSMAEPPVLISDTSDVISTVETDENASPREIPVEFMTRPPPPMLVPVAPVPTSTL
jgi:hypothetical protein